MLYTYEELIKQIKDCGQSIIDNAENILGDNRYFLTLNVNFTISRSKEQIPDIEIKRTFIPEKEVEDELTYQELKQRKEHKDVRSR